MTNSNQPHWEITSEHHFLDLKLKETWAYRDLLWLMVRRDFVSMYKQTLLGPFWFFIQPVMTTVIYTVVFGNIAGISTDGLPKPLFYLAGITIWNYFSDCFIKASGVFRDNASIFGKVYFPRLIIPLSNIVSSLVRFAVQMILFLAVIAYYAYRGEAHVHLNIYICLFPVMLVVMAGLGLGLGILVSSLTTKYRDLSFLVSFGLQLLMYATSIIYPLSAAPAKYRSLIAYNPLTAVTEAFRYAFLGNGSFSWNSLCYAALVTIVLLLGGAIVFTKTEKSFIDTV